MAFEKTKAFLANEMPFITNSVGTGEGVALLVVAGLVATGGAVPVVVGLLGGAYVASRVAAKVVAAHQEKANADQGGQSASPAVFTSTSSGTLQQVSSPVAAFTEATDRSLAYGEAKVDSAVVQMPRLPY